MRDQWVRYKMIIKQYWIVGNMKLEQVAEIMREKHGFNKKPKTYETKFREWGDEFSKNQKAALWKVMGAKVRKREKQGKTTCVYVHGNLVPKSKLRREIARYSYESAMDKYCLAPSPKTPKEVMICTPRSLPDVSYIWNNLPWFRFQEEFQYPDNASQGSIWAGFFAFAEQQSGHWKEDRLRAMILPSNPCSVDSRTEMDGVGANSQLDFFNTAMYLISNNKLDFSYELLERLEDRSYRALLLSLVCLKTTTTRVLVEKLCKFAIRANLTGLLRLLDADVIPDAWRNNSGCPVSMAVFGRQKELAMRLVRAGADLNGDTGTGVLIEATKKGYSDLVQIMIERGVDVNAQLPRYGKTALIVAAMHGNLNLVQKLIKLGADVNLPATGKITTALVEAVKQDNPGLVLLLIENGATFGALENTGLGTCMLRAAVKHGNTQLVKLLVDAGTYLNDFETPESLSTPLQAASRSGNKKLVKLLLNHAAIVNAPALVEGCLLKIAVEQGSFEIVNMLIQAGAVVNPPLLEYSSSGLMSHGTALNEAVRKDDVELVQLLLDHGADPNALNHAGQYRQTDLYTAVCQGSVHLAQLLLSAGALVNNTSEYLSESRGWYEETALHAAVQRCNLQLVHTLLQAGADASISATFFGRFGDYQATTLEIAAEHHNSDIVRLLLTASSNMTADCKAYALQAAIDPGDLDLVRLLLEAGADVNTRPSRGTRGTPLQESVRNGNHQLVAFLLDAGATINAPGAGTCGTALQEAVSMGDISSVMLLLAAGADANAPAAGRQGNTALQHAVRQGSVVLAQLILCAGADVDGNHSGEPLRMAAERGDAELIELLLRFNAAVDPPSSQGDTQLTPLQVAAKLGNLIIVTRLLEKGANIDAGTKDWRGTALQAAAREGHIHIVKILLDRGANINTVSEAAFYGTALHEAIDGQHHQLAFLLLNRHADLNIPGPIFLELDEGWVQGTALQSAIDNGSLQLARLLVEAGARADVLTADDQERRTPLEAAMEKDDDDVVQLVLKAGADVNLPGRYKLGPSCALDWYKGAALVAAVSRQSVQKVQSFLSAQADVNTPVEVISWMHVVRGQLTPLQAAVATSNSVITELLLDAGADPSIDTHFPYYHLGQCIHPCSGSLLAVAIQMLDVKIVHLLIQCGAAVDVPARGNFGRTALQAAVGKGNVELVELLLQMGADVNASPSEKAGATAFQLAAILGYAGIASILLDAGADPNAERAAEEGRTALEGAAEHGRTDLVQLILNAGDAIGLPGQKYAKALDLAVTSGHDVIADMIKTAITNADSA